MSAVAAIPASTTRFGLSAHAVTRWIERVNPRSAFPEAREELLTFLLGGVARSERPRWAVGETAGQPGARTLYVTNPVKSKIAVVLEEREVTAETAVAVTVLIDNRRERDKQARRERKRARGYVKRSKRAVRVRNLKLLGRIQ
jgi:hypothetical protein